MKKLLGIVVLGLYLSGNGNANIFDCEIVEGAIIDLTIVVEDNIEKTLTTVDNNELRFDSDDHIVIRSGNNGKLIITESNDLISKGSYDLFVFVNQKKMAQIILKQYFLRAHILN